LSALCVLFDNRSAASTPSLAALHLSPTSYLIHLPGDRTLVNARL